MSQNKSFAREISRRAVLAGAAGLRRPVAGKRFSARQFFEEAA